jgi:hypothetical protein
MTFIEKVAAASDKFTPATTEVRLQPNQPRADLAVNFLVWRDVSPRKMLLERPEQTEVWRLQIGAAESHSHSVALLTYLPRSSVMSSLSISQVTTF